MIWNYLTSDLESLVKCLLAVWICTPIKYLFKHLISFLVFPRCLGLSSQFVRSIHIVYLSSE